MGQPPSIHKCTAPACCQSSSDVGTLKVDVPGKDDDAVDVPQLEAITNSKVSLGTASDYLRSNCKRSDETEDGTGSHGDKSVGFIEIIAHQGADADKSDVVSPRPQPTSTYPVQSEDLRVEYVVVLQKNGNAKLGLEVDRTGRNGATLSISAISGGPAAEWNANATEGEKIVPGDAIIQVNDSRGDAESMMQGLHEQIVRLLLSSSTHRSRYEGQWQDNAWHGDGALERPDGSRYEGQFVNGAAHGQGRFFAANGNKYEGQWERDCVHGFGKYTWADGSTYEGDWCQNKKSGKGKQIYLNGYSYEGEFLDDSRHGVGTQWQLQRVVYEGQWRKDKMDGDGKHTCPRGRTFAGQWQNGEMSGHGRMRYPTGSTYEGGYEKHSKHGEGTFTWSDGRMYSGQWRNGKQDGTGSLTDSQGVCLGESTFRDGKRVDFDSASDTPELHNLSMG